MGCKNSRNNTAAINCYELTTQQNNISDLQKYYEGTAISNICCAIIYDEARDLGKLESSIRQVIASQTALRLRFSLLYGRTPAPPAVINQSPNLHLPGPGWCAQWNAIGSWLHLAKYLMH